MDNMPKDRIVDMSAALAIENPFRNGAVVVTTPLSETDGKWMEFTWSPGAECAAPKAP